MCRSVTISLPVLSPLPSGRVRSGVSCYTWDYTFRLHIEDGADIFCMFPLFLKRTDVLALHLSVVFQRLLVWVVSLLAADRPMSLQFRKVHRPNLLPITDRFP